MKRGVGVRRAVVAVATAGLLAGCGGGPEGVTTKVLSRADLADATLGEDAEGFQFTEPKDPRVVSGRPACGNVGSVFVNRTRPEPEAQLTTAGADDRMPRESHFGLLRLVVQAHTYVGAKKTMRTFRKDLADCVPYDSQRGQRMKAVRDEVADGLGDEALGYRLVAGRTELKREQSTVVAVVRAGSVVMVAFGESVDAEAKSVRDVRESLERVMRAQIDRLPRAE
ncbi:hypothetical protein ACFW9D_31130 [Streptomyces sp. NPDC059524]|uniref:hypothetical protein n=1 Tax=Streptomyces sp. NPDC059524 TaxID=3346856 RepID=UPI00368AC88D